MARLAAIFTALCMVLIAGSLGALLYLTFGLSGGESSLVALTALTGLVIGNMISTRFRDRADMGDQIADLSRLTGDLSRQMAELQRQLAAAEVRIDGAVNRARAASGPLAAEIGELSNLVKQLAGTVAAHETVLAERPAAPVVAAPAPPGAVMDSPKEKNEDSPTEKNAVAATAQFSGMDRDGVVALIRDAVEANRIDLYLQPIVTLPQRKVRYYEALSRLRSEAGEQVLAADFLPHAESAGLMPKIDNLLLFRCVQVLRRLLMKSPEIGLFCNVSATTLGDAEFFPQFIEFMQANKVLGPSLVFEFTQSALRAMGPREYESLAALAGCGFSFSLDNVTDLRIEPRDLSQRGFKFIKVPAALLLDRNSSSGLDAAGLSELLARSGIDLIAARIESENSVVELLDHEVKFGQGFLFSHPRPVRADALQGTADQGDIVGNNSDATIAQPQGAVA
jgi:cyclic-di-GMP phosphodiesterase TipF (flagellum assembly factor)